MMRLSIYYKLFNRFKTGKTICYGINLARIIGIRYLVVRMDTNFICNLRCKTCYFSGPKARQLVMSPMKLDYFKTIAKDVFPKTRLLFLSCGGEPLMTKGFENFLEVTSQYSIPYVGYVTNGLLLTEDIIRSSMENKIKEITISIDGATKETYEYIRTGGNFETLISKLSLYKEIVSKTNGHKPTLRFNFTVCKSNYHEMPILINLAKQFGVSLVKFRIYTDWGGQLSFNEESLRGVEESFNSSLDEAKRLALDAKIHLIAPNKFRLDENRKSSKRPQVLQKVACPSCLYPWFYRYIDPIGKIRVCANLPMSEMSLSNSCSMNDFEKSEEEVTRKYLLRKRISESCFTTICKGGSLKRSNDDVNFL